MKQLLTTIAAVVLASTAFAAPIHEAAEKGDLATVKVELAKGVDVDASDDKWPEGTPLHRATTAEIAEYLIDHGADVDARDKVGASPLHYASKEVARVLIANGTIVDAKTKGGATPLHFAAAGGDVEAAELLIDEGADLNARDEFGTTPMHDAAVWGEPEAVELLIRQGADIDARDTWGGTPLHRAIPLHWTLTKEHLQVVEVLLENGADFDALDDSGKNPMNRAISKVNKELVGMLIDAGVELNNGEFFHLHHAVSTGNQEVVLALVEGGADVNRKTLDGNPPLNSTHHFLEFDMEMFELLLSKGAVVDVRVAWMAYFSWGVAMNLTDDYLKSIFRKMDDISEKLLANGVFSGATLLDIVASDNNEDLTDFIRELGGKHSSIIWAAIAGDINAVEVFLDAGVDVNSKSEDGKTALDFADPKTAEFLKKHGAKSGAVDSLLVASMLGNVEVVKTHLAAGADVEMENAFKETPLHLAAREGHLEVVKLLIGVGAEVNAQLEGGTTPLDRVNAFSHPKLAEYLREHGAKTHEWFKAGESIYIAAKVGHVEAVRQHIADGADVDKKDDWSNKNPLFLAIEGGHLEVVKVLVESGVTIDAKDEWSGRTALHLAADRGHSDIMKFLIAEGADVKVSSNGRYTVLHDIARNGLVDIVRLLIDKGANVNTSSNSGETVLGSAVAGGHVEVVKILIAEGADVNAKDDSWGYTLLHSAADRGHKALVEILLENGADVNAAKSDGETPLFSAILGYYDEASDRKAIVELLIANGADVNVTSTFHAMPLDRAISREYPEIAELLIRHGAKMRKEIKTGLLSYKGNGQLALYGHIGLVYVVEYSAELEEWKPKRALTLESSPQLFVDGERTGQATRFYRMRLK